MLVSVTYISAHEFIDQNFEGDNLRAFVTETFSEWHKRGNIPRVYRRMRYTQKLEDDKVRDPT